MELQTNVIDFNQIANACGSAVIEGATVVHSEAKTYTVKSKAITLDHTPLDETSIQIIDVAKDVVLKETTDYTVEGTTVTFTTLDNADVRVLPYEYTSVEGAKQITIAADKFSKAGKLVLKSIMVDNEQNATDYIEIVIEKAKFASDFTISSSSEISNGNDNTINITAIVDDNGNLGYIRTIPIA